MSGDFFGAKFETKRNTLDQACAEMHHTFTHSLVEFNRCLNNKKNGICHDYVRCFLNFTSFFLSSACIHMLIFSLPTFILFWWLLIHVNQQEMNSLQYSGLEIWTSSFSFSSLLIFLFFYFFIFFNFLFIFWNFLLIFSSPFFSLSLSVWHRFLIWTHLPTF